MVLLGVRLEPRRNLQSDVFNVSMAVAAVPDEPGGTIKVVDRVVSGIVENGLVIECATTKALAPNRFPASFVAWSVHP